MLITQMPAHSGAARRRQNWVLAGLVFIAVMTAAYIHFTSAEGVGSDKPGQLSVPESIKAEHEELHAGLAASVAAGGRVAEAAREVEEVLSPHFTAEEEYALPPLGLLPLLAQGGEPPRVAGVIPMTEKMKANLPRMLQEHKAVGAALEKLRAASLEEKKPEHARFAEKLLLHAHNEEEVLYPAALLVGEYLKLKAKK